MAMDKRIKDLRSLDILSSKRSRDLFKKNPHIKKMYFIIQLEFIRQKTYDKDIRL